MDEQNILALYTQLVGVGMLWVTIHSSGMCGPIIAGLVVHTHPRDAHTSLWRQRWSAVQHVLAYQSGRGAMYAILGMLAGLLGAQLEARVKPIAAIASLVVAVLLILAGSMHLSVVQRWRARRRARSAASTANTLSGGNIPLSARFVSAVMRRLPTPQQLGSRSRMLVTGFMLGLLPCSLMFWVMGLAASSASPLHGALLMLTLVMLTTPVLVAAGLSTTFISPKLRRLGQHAVPAGMIFSGTWLALISMAANGWIEHFHTHFHLGEKSYMFMLW